MLLLAPAFAAPPAETAFVQPGDIAAGWCSACGEERMRAVTRTATASSELTEGSLVFAPGLAVDGRTETAWCEGVEGAGAGEWLQIDLARPMELEAVQIWSGYFLDAARLASNGRPRKITLEVDGTTVVLPIADPTVPTPSCTGCDDWFARTLLFPFVVTRIPGDAPARWTERPVSVVRLRIDEVWLGTRHADTCISEVVLDTYLTELLPESAR